MSLNIVNKLDEFVEVMRRTPSTTATGTNFLYTQSLLVGAFPFTHFWKAICKSGQDYNNERDEFHFLYMISAV